MTGNKLSKKSRMKLQSADSPSLIEMITRFWVTLLVIAVILYASILMISRTDGFKGLVRQRIEAFVEIPLTIDRVRVSPSLDLVIEGLREAAATNRIVRIDVQRAEMYWKLIPLLRGSGWPFRVLKLDTCALRFVQDKSGAWTPLPHVHRSLAPWVEGVNPPDNTESGQNGDLPVTEYLRQVRAKIQISNLQIEWLEPGKEDIPLALVQGISFSSEAVEPMSEKVLWCKLHIHRAMSEGTVWLDQLELEWIRLHDQDIVLRTTAVQVVR